MHSLPDTPSGTSLPWSSRITGSTPKNGRLALPGFRVCAPGSGVIRMPPVSVCHHVSTTGIFPWPTTLRYHSHTSGLIGSPTDPSSLRLARLRLRTGSSPSRMSARMAVGAV